MPLKEGDTIPGAAFTDHAGRQWNLPQELKDGKLALFFLRHLGCPLCKETIARLQAASPRFQEKGIQVIVVVQGTPRRVREYAAKQALPFSLVADREKRLYSVFEVRTGGFKEFTAPAVLKASVQATMKGHLHGWFEGDELQVPASFLVGPEGVVLYAYYGKDISDFGDLEALLARG